MTFRTTTNANTERVRSDHAQACPRGEGQEGRAPQASRLFHAQGLDYSCVRVVEVPDVQSGPTTYASGRVTGRLAQVYALSETTPTSDRQKVDGVGLFIGQSMAAFHTAVLFKILIPQFFL